MFHRLLADFIVLLHFLWIAFMLWGFFATLYSVIFKKYKFLCKRFLRIFHLVGIIFVGFLIIIQSPCPLTIWEIRLRSISGVPSYTGSFIVHYIEKIVYPDVHPLIVEIPSILIGLSTLFFYIFFSPFRISKEGIKK